MQKKLIALAVAGLVSAPVFAQSNVTVYGIADAGIGVGKHGDNDFRGVLSGVLSGSRIGFKGSEDLGNGLKGVFQLEQGFDIGNGAAADPARTAFSRQAWVGLQGAFGTASLGRQYAPGYFTGPYDVVDGSSIGPQSILSNGSGMTITPNSAARWDNSVAYQGTFMGLTTRAIYSAKTNENDTFVLGNQVSKASADDAWGLGVDYANGPLRVGGMFHRVKTDTGLASNDAGKEWLVGASYDFGMLKLAGSYQRGEDIGALDDEAKVWQLGVAVPVGPAGNVLVAYGRADNELTGGLDDAGAKSWTVGYTHALSKRTTGYVVYNRTTNEDDTSNYGVIGNGGSGDLGENSSVFTVGVRHTF
jgi:predicted porin